MHVFKKYDSRDRDLLVRNLEVYLLCYDWCKVQEIIYDVGNLFRRDFSCLFVPVLQFNTFSTKIAKIFYSRVEWKTVKPKKILKNKLS